MKVLCIFAVAFALCLPTWSLPSPDDDHKKDKQEDRDRDKHDREEKEKHEREQREHEKHDREEKEKHEREQREHEREEKEKHEQDRDHDRDKHDHDKRDRDGRDNKERHDRDGHPRKDRTEPLPQRPQRPAPPVSSSSSTEVTNNSSVSEPKIPVSSAIAPQILPTVPCLKGYGGAVQTMGIGGSFGGGKIDEGCDARELARSFSGLSKLAQCKVLVNTKAAKKAKVTLEDCMYEPPVIEAPVVEREVLTPAPSPLPVVIIAPAPAPVVHRKKAHRKPCVKGEK